ncbi:hypothetical protein E4U60_005219 [Claviceps pazoutovae]|uniref:Developmental regulatory protein wetA n=1 Tax=Claviceps pazoutovae TaxID=1649127 RepID=A0A9P7MH36_9HYPO|nr:hypothetical protein E4U60_005219 [Claviceps pazoutovae]
MASWTVPVRAEAVDNNTHPAMYWEDMNSASPDDHADFFGQFVDFEGNTHANIFIGDDFGSMTASMPGMTESIMLMGNHNPILDGLSSAISSGDEFDFPSSSSHVDAVSAAGHEATPKDLTLNMEDLLPQGNQHPYDLSQSQTQHQHAQQHPQQYAQQPQHHYHHHHHQHQQQQHQGLEYLNRASMSEADLSRLQEISLHSPHRPSVAASDPSSPPPPATEVRKPKKFVDALSATLKKAKKLRKGKKSTPGIVQQGSPIQEESESLRIPKQRGRGKVRAGAQGNAPVSPPMHQQPQPQQSQPQPQHEDPANAHFVHGTYEDPFRDTSLLPPQGLNAVYNYGHAAPSTPSVESPGVGSNLSHGQFQIDPVWHHHQQSQQQQQQQQQQLHWNGSGGEYITSSETGWWTPNMMSQSTGDYAHQHHQHHQQPQHLHQRSASVHVMGHSQTPGFPYEYDAMPDTSSGGLMIHMPQPRGSQSNVALTDLTTNAQTFLPPPLPISQTMLPASERSHRPPRAKSSGARHMSCSPVRKQRMSSASPTPGEQANILRSRHSSGASISSTRSSSGRLPGTMPGTPCSVRKRRSRDVSGSSAGASLGGDSGVGFVNFTPNDGGVLMTGVAPSGSSKTKARREKEAQERRRRLSEAAIKAVAAAGGDVDKLLEQGFTF